MSSRLLLAKETLRRLSTTRLRTVAAGNVAELQPSIDYACSDLPDCNTVGAHCGEPASDGCGTLVCTGGITVHPVSRDETLNFC